MKCVHTLRTGRHKRQADITLLFQYITKKRIFFLYGVIKENIILCWRSINQLP